MIRTFNGKTPKIAESAFISEWAYIVGDVEIGENTGVWPGAVIRGDFGSIRIGNNCQIEDNSVVHSGTSMEIGNNVIIGHSAIIHGLKIGNNVLVGNNATILDDADIGDRCIIGSNSIVSTGQKVPSDSLAIGIPVRFKKGLLSQGTERKHHRAVETYYQAIKSDRPQRLYSELARRYKQQGL
jgi:carbonic anhydrase/acetyltransferase-like protein (isoleucine patch superfamily)